MSLYLYPVTIKQKELLKDLDIEVLDAIAAYVDEYLRKGIIAGMRKLPILRRTHSKDGVNVSKMSWHRVTLSP